MNSNSSNPIFRQMALSRNSSYLERTEKLEKKLQFCDISDEERTRIEKEIDEIRDLLRKNEAEINKFSKENNKTYFFSVLLMFFAFLFYGLYRMVYGTKEAS